MSACPQGFDRLLRVAAPPEGLLTEPVVKGDPVRLKRRLLPREYPLDRKAAQLVPALRFRCVERLPPVALEILARHIDHVVARVGLFRHRIVLTEQLTAADLHEIGRATKLV